MSAPSLLFGAASAAPQAQATPRGPNTNAPPGPEPPGSSYQSAEEVATKEPNAPAQKPDLGPTTEAKASEGSKAEALDNKGTDQPTAAADASSQAADQKLVAAAAMQALLAASNVSAFATPVPAPTPKVATAAVEALLSSKEGSKNWTTAQAKARSTSVPTTPSLASKATAALATESNAADTQDASASKPLSSKPEPTQISSLLSNVPLVKPSAPSSSQLEVPSDAKGGVALAPAGPSSGKAQLPVDATAPIVAVATVAATVKPVSTVALEEPEEVHATQVTALSATVAAPKEVAKAAKASAVIKKDEDASPDDVPSASTTATAEATGQGANGQAEGEAEEGKSSGQAVVELQKTSVEAAPSTPVAVAGPAPQAQSGTASAVSASTPLSKSDTHAVIQQMTDHIEFMAAVNPKDGVTIHLQPPDLGSVSLTIKSVGKTVDAQIFASNSSVRDALEQNRPQLTASVQHRGLQLGNVSFGSQASNTGNHQQSTSRQASEATQDHLTEGGKNSQDGQKDSRRGEQQTTSNTATTAAPQTQTLRGLGRRAGFDLSI